MTDDAGDAVRRFLQYLVPCPYNMTEPASIEVNRRGPWFTFKVELSLFSPTGKTRVSLNIEPSSCCAYVHLVLTGPES